MPCWIGYELVGEIVPLRVDFGASKAHAMPSLSLSMEQDICRTLSYFSITMLACLPLHSPPW